MRIRLKEFDSYDEYLNKQVTASAETRVWPVYMDRCRHAIENMMPWWIPGSVILDAGCGDGYGMDVMREHGFNPIGVDISQEKIMIATEHGHQAVKSELHCIPHSDGFFDAVYCRHVLEHLLKPKETLDEFWRVMKMGARLSLIVPIVDTDDWRSKHPHLVPNQEYVEWLIRNAGFHIYRIATIKDKCGPEVWVWARKISKGVAS